MVDVTAHDHFGPALARKRNGARGFVRRTLGGVLERLKGVERQPDLPDLPREHFAKAHGIGDLLGGPQRHKQGARPAPQHGLGGHIHGWRLTAHKVVYLHLKRRPKITGDVDGSVAVVRRGGAAAQKHHHRQRRHQCPAPACAQAPGIVCPNIVKNH